MQEEESFQSNDHIRTHFFLFINQSSGGGLGSRILEKQIEEVSFKLQSIKETIHVYFYSLNKNRKKGFGHLKRLTQKDKKTVAIVCGGDGTVIWVVNQFINYHIDPLKVPIAIIPIGTGNDFSQELGWGVQQKSILQNSFKELKILLKEWIQAKQEFFDLWDVSAQVYDNGFFEKVDSVLDTNVKLEGKKWAKTMSNYFSFGMDGKIGYSFDRHRTKSRWGNLIMYSLLGTLKTMTATKSVKTLLENMQIRQDFSDEIPAESKIIFHGFKSKGEEGSQFTSSYDKSKIVQNESSKKGQIFPNEATLQNVIISSEKAKSEIQQKNFSIERLERDYCNILAMNINSFMGGAKDIWAKANKNQPTNPPSTFDGNLQIVAFGSSFGLAAQKIFGGLADRITQGKGPYYFKFKAYENQAKHRTYLQCDGEFYRVTHPKFIVIRRSDLVVGSQIKVLRKNTQKA